MSFILGVIRHRMGGGYRSQRVKVRIHNVRRMNVSFSLVAKSVNFLTSLESSLLSSTGTMGSSSLPGKRLLVSRVYVAANPPRCLG